MDFLKESIEKWVSAAFHDERLFLIEVKIFKSRYMSIIIVLDSDYSVSINDCTRVARCVKERLAEMALSQNYNLEVTSAGIGQPLKVFRQYKKNLNQRVNILLKDGKVCEGRLVSVTPENLLVASKQGVECFIQFRDIKQTAVVQKV